MKTFFLSIFVVFTLDAQTPFSLDSATAFLKTLSVDVGPRPMGSPYERRAMEFAVQKFREFGLHEAYVMPMTSVERDILGTSTNTRSGIAVGLLKGATDRIILIGGHIDSAGPEIPGANDDGSGSATVIELARVLSKRRNESTIVFCLFGGEEAGLRGSKYFVEHFPSLAKVKLMLQVDMANGSDWLVPLIDQQGKSSPSWLVRAAFEECEKLGYSGLSYPTHFFALNSMLPGGGIGSDHMPFLEKDIPSIDFTSDINDPIHTPQDNFGAFKTDGLKRSGDLVYKLVERFDSGGPDSTVEEYYFFHFGNVLFFIPMWALYTLILLSLIIAGYGLLVLRGRRVEVDKTARPRIPGLKLFFLLLIIQTCVWFSELIVGLIKGDRYPWYSDVTGYFILGGLAGLMGIWLALQILPRLNLSRDPYRYHLRSIVVLTVILLLFLPLSSKAALYPATAIVLLTVSTLARHPWVKLTLWFFSPYLLYRFFFNEGFPLFARTLPEASITAGIGFSVVWHLFLILFFSLCSFPFLLGFASIYAETRSDMPWLTSFRQRWGFILVAVALGLCIFWLATLPSYSESWKQNIRVDQDFDQQTAKGAVYVRSGEYLKGASLRCEGRDTSIHSWTREVKVMDIFSVDEPWIKTERRIQKEQDSSGTMVHVLCTLRFKFAPSSAQLTYNSKKSPLKRASSVLAHTTLSRSISLRWYSFPDTVIIAPLEFTVAPDDTVYESVEATFIQPLIRVEASKPFSNVSTRSTLRTRTSILP
jgi:hypothetical protein